MHSPPAWYTRASMTRYRLALVCLLLFLAALALRLPGLGSFLTPDENLWATSHDPIHCGAQHRRLDSNKHHGAPRRHDDVGRKPGAVRQVAVRTLS